MDCTDLKQSKELVELGLKVESADLVWCIVESGEFELRLKDYTITKDTFSYRYGLSIPAWSAEALLSQIPVTIKVKDVCFNFNLSHKEGYWYAAYMDEVFECCAFRGKWKSLVCMLTSIMKWLLENKYKEI